MAVSASRPTQNCVANLKCDRRSIASNPVSRIFVKSWFCGPRQSVLCDPPHTALRSQPVAMSRPSVVEGGAKNCGRPRTGLRSAFCVLSRVHCGAGRPINGTGRQCKARPREGRAPSDPPVSRYPIRPRRSRHVRADVSDARPLAVDDGPLQELADAMKDPNPAIRRATTPKSRRASPISASSSTTTSRSI